MPSSKTIAVSIRREPDDVYDYLVHPANFSEWSMFVTNLRKDGEFWIADTPSGSVRIRFTPRNEYRVLDHQVTIDSDLTVYVPMRVLANQAGASEVIFTVFRLPGMTDAQFENDVRMVATDLERLKRRLEV